MTPPATALFDMTGRGSIVILGRDRSDFLHGLVTNEIHKLVPGAGCHAALLTPKGKMRADLVALCRADDLLVDCEAELADPLEALFQTFIYFQQVKVENRTSSEAVLHLAGPRAKEMLSGLGAGDLPAAPHSHRPASLGDFDTLVVAETRSGHVGFDLRLSRESAPSLARALEEAGAVPTPAHVLESSRIEAGIPRWGRDLDESVLPNEAWFERDAISYAKGCYVGQEIVARLKTYGHVNRHLVGLVLAPSALLAPGSDVFSGSTRVGSVTSVTVSDRLGKTVALAYVKCDVETPGTLLEVATGGEHALATVTAFPIAG